MAQFTILKPGTPQQSVVVCLRCNAACELCSPSTGKTMLMTLLTGPIGFFAQSLDTFWKCHVCRKEYRHKDFKRGRIQSQRYTGEALPTYQPR